MFRLLAQRSVPLAVLAERFDFPEEALLFFLKDGLSPGVQRALQIAKEAHRHQRDKGGAPYLYHPIHVACQLREDEAIQTALLHDVVEDSELRLDDLRAEGFSERVISALDGLSRRRDEPYGDYIARLAGHQLAREVKIHDLRHNLDVGRLRYCTARDARRLEKYRQALEELMQH